VILGEENMHVKVSKKGQIVIPKEIREKLGIKEGSNLKIKLDGKRIILESFSEPSEEIFIKAGDNTTEPIIRDAKESSDKSKKLLKALGIE